VDELRSVRVAARRDWSTDATRATAAAVPGLPRTESGAGVAHQEQRRLQGLSHRSTQVSPASTGTEAPLCLTADQTAVSGRTSKGTIIWLFSC